MTFYSKNFPHNPEGQYEIVGSRYVCLNFPSYCICPKFLLTHLIAPLKLAQQGKQGFVGRIQD